MPYDTSTELSTTGLESFTRVYTVYQANPQLTGVPGTYPVSSDVPVAYQGTPFYSDTIYSQWKFIEAASEYPDSDVMIDFEPYVINPASSNFRENDPYYTNILAALRTQREMAYALEKYAQMAYDNEARIGFYDYVPLIYRNINRVLNNTPGDFNRWMRDSEKVALTKVYNGLSMVDIINGFSGKFYVTCYVPTSAFDTNDFQRGRFRRYVKRLMSFYNGLGMNAVPLLYPFYTNTASTPVSATLIQGIIDDVEAYQPGEWGVWGDIGLVTELQWTAFKAIVTG